MHGRHTVDQTLMFMPLEAVAARDRQRLDTELSRLSAEDPAFICSSDPPLALFWLHGNSEVQLEKHIDLLRAACGVEMRFGTPQVTYIEMPMKRAEVAYTRRTVVGSKFARVKLILQPTAADRPLTFEDGLSDASMPQTFLHAVEHGILGTARSGILAGFPVRGVHVALTDFARSETSTAEAFEEAACAAFREGLRCSGSFLFEPLMKATITMPEAYEGSVAGDMLGRRGLILDRATDGLVLTLTATVPLANMFGYASQLRSFTQGHGTFTMQFDRYERAPTPSNDPPFRSAAALRVA